LVRYEPRQGKGFVVQRMFEEVEADVYVMVDGDDTYDANDVRRLIAPIVTGDAEMVVGSRLAKESNSQFRLANRWGNDLFLKVINRFFGVRLSDILSGYRVFT